METPGQISVEINTTIPTGSTSQYIRGNKTLATLNKSAVGLASVDNTSDANKPISTATQTALNGKQPLATVLTNTTASFTTELETKLAGLSNPRPTAIFTLAGKTLDGEAIPTLAPAGFTITQADCIAKAATAATAQTVFTFKQGATTLGTATFAAGATVAAWAITGTIAEGDLIVCEAPATADATLSDIVLMVR